jgi:hypothetical protein
MTNFCTDVVRHVTGSDDSVIDRCSILWARWQTLLSIAQKSSDGADIERALAAWSRWLAVFIPNAEQRAAIPTPTIVSGIH